MTDFRSTILTNLRIYLDTVENPHWVEALNDTLPELPFLHNEKISSTLEKAKSRKVLLYTKGRKYGKIEGTSQFNNTLLRNLRHSTQDSPGVCGRQRARDLGLPVTLPGAAGQPRCGTDRGLHHQT